MSNFATLDTKATKALMETAAIDDVRYYLNGVFVEFLGNRIQMTSTDGHCLLTHYRDSDLYLQRDPIIIPLNTLKLAMSAKDLAETWDLTIRDDGKCEILAGDRELIFRPIDGVYPDWRRVIPSETSGEPGFIHPFYLAKMQRAFNVLRGFKVTNQSNPVSILHNGNGAHVVTVDDCNCIGIMMPMRHTNDQDLVKTTLSKVMQRQALASPEAQEGENVAAPMDDNLAAFQSTVSVVADDVEKIRKSDIERLIDVAYQVSAQYGDDFTDWLKTRRPGLKAEINKAVNNREMEAAA